MLENHDPSQDATTVADAAVYTESVRRLVAGIVLLKRYSMQRLLGKGGMGAVWLAQDLELSEEVALKFLPEMVSRDKAAIEELKLEVRRGRRATHPHIVRIHDYLQDADWSCISMEYVNGATLSDLRVRQPGHVFRAKDLEAWIRQLCSALDYAHSQAKMVHHDLKPSNCMVTVEGDLKLCDFGIARSLSDSVTRLTTHERTSGTLIYMSPQQLMGDDPSALDDIYSLGATLYELLSSKPPFYSGNIATQVLEKKPVLMMQRRQALGIEAGLIPKEWEETVVACLAKDALKRPQTAGEVMERLGLAEGRAKVKVQHPELPVKADEPVVAPPSAKRQAMGGRWPWVLGISAFFLLGVGAWYWGVHIPAEKARQAKIEQLEEQRRMAESRAKVEKDMTERTRLEAEAKKSAGEAEALRTAMEKQRLGQERLASARGGVMVKTIPEGAMVTLGGQDLQKSPAVFKSLTLGKYPVKIRMDGYEPVEMEAIVRENEFTEMGPVNLVRSTGLLEISTTPDGVEYAMEPAPDHGGAGSAMPSAAARGKTPASLKDVPTGDYEIVFRRAGWPEVRQRVTVQRQTPFICSYVFKTGRVRLTSAPDGLEILEGGKSLGKTPLEVELPAGRHEFLARLGKFAEKKLEAMVEPERTSSVHGVIETGRVAVESVPSGAQVRINGREAGRTPIPGLVLPVGDYELEMSLDDHDHATSRFVIREGEEKKVRLSLVSPKMEKWKRMVGTYHGKLMDDSHRSDWMIDFKIEIYGEPNAPMVSYTRTLTSLMKLPSVSRCSNDPKVKSRFPVSVRYPGGNVLHISEKDNVMNQVMSYAYTLTLTKDGEISVAFAWDSHGWVKDLVHRGILEKIE